MNEKSPIWQFLKNTKRVFGMAWRTDAKTFFWIILLTIFTALFPVALSYMFKLLLDAIIRDHSTTGVVSTTLLSIFAFRYILVLVSEFANNISGWYLEPAFRQKFDDRLTFEFVKKMSELDIPHLENTETQNLIQKARQAYPWRLLNFYQFLTDGGSNIVMFVAAVAVVLSFGFWIPLVMILATVPRFYYKSKYVKANWQKYNEKVSESKDLNYIRGLLEDPSGVKEIRVAQAGPHLLRRVKKLQGQLFEVIRRPLEKYLPGFLVSMMLEIVILALLVYLKLPDAVAGVITIGSLTFYLQNLDQISRISRALAGDINRIFEQNLYVGYFFEVLDLPKIIKDKDPGFTFDEIAPPKIEFRNVSFGYDGGPMILKNVSFTVQPGEHLAIVGPNGAGKTTMVRLLLRFYDPTKGQILINDVDLRDIKLANWYKFASILFQDYVKFSLTIKDNILLGDSSTIDQNRMEDAANKSGASEFINKLPKRYEQRLGKRFDDSAELSQGQWQKLALARMFYESAPVLILDEPTSAIDAEAEAEIFENIDKVYKDKNLILISHRFSTVRNAHKIIVLKEGQIVEEGSHKELMEKNSIYATMFRKQAKGYIE